MIKAKTNASELPASEFAEVKLVACDAEVLHDVGNDAARNIAGMPRKGDDAIGAEGIGVMPVAAGAADIVAANFTEATIQLSAVVSWKFAHGSSGQEEFVAKGRRNWASGFQQSLQVSFGGFLESENSFSAIAAMGMAAGQQTGFGNPNAVLIASCLDFGNRNYHWRDNIQSFSQRVNAAVSRN